ncbi:programmed cell death 1 ligand 1-like [Sebastes fasciatus]|uniref:programmed cell death 1 ligand 1-like n=1 Tax=Sebastes fasciatus TaxID=394691 RepID=UPI003D9F324B
MIYYSILLLLSLPSCVRGSFVLNVTQTSYQAEENHNITLEWMFPTRTDSSLNSLFIYCELFTELRPSVLFHFHGGVEVPESQDQQFTGRVRCDKDVLRDGRIRLHMSRLRINDSGVYRCDVQTGVGSGSRICSLKVTAAADEPEPQRPTVRPQPERPAVRPQPERPTVRRRRNIFYFGLRLTAGLLVVCAGLWFAAFVFRRLNLLIIEDRSIQSYRR